MDPRSEIDRQTPHESRRPGKIRSSCDGFECRQLSSAKLNPNLRYSIHTPASSAFRELNTNLLGTMKHFHLRRFSLSAALRSVLVRCADECTEQRMRLERLRFEFRMKLASDEVRMIRQFYHLDVGCIGR